jgi:ABC-type uncharacterized transport system substrate-binding protein
MKRRGFITLVGAAAAWPLAARAQHASVPVVGYLSSVSADPSLLAAFSRGLSDEGYIEGRNVRIEYRYANGQYERLPALTAELVSLPTTVIATVGSSPSAIAAKRVSELAQELVERRVDVIVALATPAVRAAKKATSAIPIVGLGMADPVEDELASSLVNW